ncbi:membrane protein [Streptomyces capoamus]|uniref:Membrane protein n=1 Tax=Streptomyces capoamus TaxID=68183 RepID=A0A919C5A1_9ACTN|nr:DUF2510 domain-containing protein [Streptomyces capoamus]GGW10062.1 membrane protein [Streptomyces libani subsp. rufus]GHG51127.1 membrane protein [Streptomyces capoamus]
MTQVTPPGWYPDPGQQNDGPPTERWWDGKAWTDGTRPAGPAAAWGPPAPAGYGAHPGHPAHPGYPAQPAYPGYPAQPPARSRRGLRTGIAVAVTATVLACVVAGVYALTRGDDGGGDRAGSRQGPGGGQRGPGGPGGPGGSGGASPSPRGSEAPKVEGGGSVPDPANGISLPVPKGWTGQAIKLGAQVTSGDSYACPGDTAETCTPGGAYTAPAALLGAKGDTAEEVAKADIAANAKASYGGTTYGGITSHRQLASEAVTVAGQKGYLVRWKAVTRKGADGYVESVAFPSPNDARRIVVVRFGVDAGQELSVIDEILKGIKVSSGGGNGQDV